MHVIVFADRSGSELHPLTDTCPPALLPVAAKPLIVHCLEDLAVAGIRSLTLVVSKHADMIKGVLGTGTRWGLNIEFVLSRGEEHPASLLERIELPQDQGFLCLRGDVLRSPSIASLLEALAGLPNAAAELRLGGSSAQVVHLRQIDISGALDRIAWPPPDSAAPDPNLAEHEVASGRFYPIADFRGYHRANLDAVSERLPGLLMPGRNLALGLLVGRHSKVSPRSVRQGVALIGSNCRIDASVAFHGEVVVSDNVLIDRDAEIRDSVILPNTYVGQLVDIRNAIVRGSDLIRVDTGAHLHVNDTFLIADLAVSGTTEHLTRPLNRLLALLLLAISTPLWVIAALLAMLVSPKNPLSRQRLRGNRIELNEFGIRQRKAFSAGVWQCRPPVLRYLPRILAVVTGHLNMVGTVPITEEKAAERLEEWQREADRAPSGLIGPSQLLLPRQAVDEDVILSDALYARQRNIGKDLYYLGLGLRKFFSREAWLG